MEAGVDHVRQTRVCVSEKPQNDLVNLFSTKSNLVSLPHNRTPIRSTDHIPMAFPQPGVAERVKNRQEDPKLFDLRSHCVRDSPSGWVVGKRFDELHRLVVHSLKRGSFIQILPNLVAFFN